MKKEEEGLERGFIEGGEGRRKNKKIFTFRSEFLLLPEQKISAPRYSKPKKLNFYTLNAIKENSHAHARGLPRDLNTIKKFNFYND